MELNKEEFLKTWAKVVAKAWSDPAFKAKLLKDPTAVLREQGIDIPSGQRVVVNENTGNTIHLTIPEKPAKELTEMKLKEIAAGNSVIACYCVH